MYWLWADLDGAKNNRFQIHAKKLHWNYFAFWEMCSKKGSCKKKLSLTVGSSNCDGGVFVKENGTGYCKKCEGYWYDTNYKYFSNGWLEYHCVRLGIVESCCDWKGKKGLVCKSCLQLDVLPVASLFHRFPPKLCMRSSFLPTVLHALPISSSFTW
jgi:hypothetical protein